MIKSRKLSDSVNSAVDGLIYAVKTERSLVLSLFTAFTLFLVCLWLDLDRNDFLFICSAVTFVLTAQLFNAALKAIASLMTLSHHPLAKTARDISAGAVLLSCLNALAVGYLVIVQAVKKPFLTDVLQNIRQHYTHGVIIIIILILLLVLIFKSLGGKGSFTRGGLVSGHAALAFAASTVIFCITKNILATALAFGLAALVAQSRMEARFHRLVEVVLGAFLGILVSILIFQIFFDIKPFIR